MQVKKTVYIICAAILGFLLSLFIHIFAEVLYIRSLESRGAYPEWVELFGKLEALPMWAVIGIALCGIAGGVWLGFVWWRIVYIEKRHWRFNKQQS